MRIIDRIIDIKTFVSNQMYAYSAFLLRRFIISPSEFVTWCLSYGLLAYFIVTPYISGMLELAYMSSISGLDVLKNSYVTANMGPIKYFVYGSIIIPVSALFNCRDRERAMSTLIGVLLFTFFLWGLASFFLPDFYHLAGQDDNDLTNLTVCAFITNIGNLFFFFSIVLVVFIVSYNIYVPFVTFIAIVFILAQNNLLQFFIVSLKLGFMGVPVANLCAYSTLFIILAFIVRSAFIDARFKYNLLFQAIVRLGGLGLPIGIFALVETTVMKWFFQVLNVHDLDPSLFALSVSMKFLALFYALFLSVSELYGVNIAHCIANKDRDGFVMYTRRFVILGSAFTAICVCIMYLFPAQIIQALVSDDLGYYDAVVEAMPIFGFTFIEAAIYITSVVLLTQIGKSYLVAIFGSIGYFSGYFMLQYSIHHFALNDAWYAAIGTFTSFTIISVIGGICIVFAYKEILSIIDGQNSSNVSENTQG